jgi:hypothetical protein
METVKYINNRNPQVALLALSVRHRPSFFQDMANPLPIQLLETLVAHCGYPLHLQISTKDFLNELVRRFPERPPMIMGPVMGRILEVSQGLDQFCAWCLESRVVLSRCGFQHIAMHSWGFARVVGDGGATLCWTQSPQVSLQCLFSYQHMSCTI